jgi:Acetyltransferase (GNAT) domain
VLDAMPFFWAGYRLEAMYTYRLEGLRSDEALWNGLGSNIRGHIRKARKHVEVREDLGLDRFRAELAKTYARQGMREPRAHALLDRLETACAARDARAMLFAVDESGRVHAVTYTVWDEHAAYYLMGGGDPELRTSGANSLLIWESIMRARDVTDVFDFEGSMLAPVERFFRDFGARQRMYLRVSRATAPALRAALELRFAWRRRANRRASREPRADRRRTRRRSTGP